MVLGKTPACTDPGCIPETMWDEESGSCFGLMDRAGMYGFGVLGRYDRNRLRWG